MNGLKRMFGIHQPDHTMLYIFIALAVVAAGVGAYYYFRQRQRASAAQMNFGMAPAPVAWNAAPAQPYAAPMQQQGW